MRSHICKIEDIIYEMDQIKWENRGITPTIISIIPCRFEKESHKDEYITKEVKIIYKID